MTETEYVLSVCVFDYMLSDRGLCFVIGIGFRNHSSSLELASADLLNLRRQSKAN